QRVGGQRRVVEHPRVQKKSRAPCPRGRQSGARPRRVSLRKPASDCRSAPLPTPRAARGKLQRGGTPCGNNLSCCCPVRLGGAAGLAGAGAVASAVGAASAGAGVATTGFLQSVSQTS